MKYIRTKDGRIIEVKRRRIVFPIFPAGETRILFNDNILENDVIKESDDVKELCDHLVVIEKESSSFPHIQHRFLGDLFIDHSYDEEFQQNKLIVYGAIWTDKGLIYVARMNDDGELELL